MLSKVNGTWKFDLRVMGILHINQRIDWLPRACRMGIVPALRNFHTLSLHKRWACAFRVQLGNVYNSYAVETG
jgi:hypothetical protein